MILFINFVAVITVMIILTRDGSHTIQLEDSAVTYHSIHGAIQESMHVFIKEGLHEWMKINQSTSIRIFEMGFGTGLNALLTYIEAKNLGILIDYTSVEKFPLERSYYSILNYPAQLKNEKLNDVLLHMHVAPFDTKVQLDPLFSLLKIKSDLQEISNAKPLNNDYNIIYFDAFAPRAQPELWTEAVFKQMFDSLAVGGMLVTYCSKGIVRRAMEAAGFTIQKVPGPPGKREMVRALK